MPGRPRSGEGKAEVKTAAPSRTDVELTINCDDLGMCPEANTAVIAALRSGRATSATLIVPATSAAAAARECQDLPVGVHLTLNSEWNLDRWRPLTAGPSLCTADGTFPRTPRETCARADSAEVLDEFTAQIEQAYTWGLDVTHLDAHMYIVQQRMDLFDVYLTVAQRFRLPVRVSGSVADTDHPFRRRARDVGVISPDHLVRLSGVGSRNALLAALPDLPPGVTEFHVHPAIDSPHLRRLAADWRGRVDDDRLVRDPVFWELIACSGARLTSYRDLRDAARSVGSGPSPSARTVE